MRRPHSTRSGSSRALAPAAGEPGRLRPEPLPRRRRSSLERALGDDSAGAGSETEGVAAGSSPRAGRAGSGSRTRGRATSRKTVTALADLGLAAARWRTRRAGGHDPGRGPRRGPATSATRALEADVDEQPQPSRRANRASPERTHAESSPRSSGLCPRRGRSLCREARARSARRRRSWGWAIMPGNALGPLY